MLIQTLQKKGGGVQIAGSHRNVYPCTLPPWLPDDILLRLRDLVQVQLAYMLRDVISLAETLRDRANSSDSKAVSPPPSETDASGYLSIIGIKDIVVKNISIPEPPSV